MSVIVSSTTDAIDNNTKGTEPAYETAGRSMQVSRSPRATSFAEQILRTCQPFFVKPISELRVLDIGCGYGATTLALGEKCQAVTGIDPSQRMVATAIAQCENSGDKQIEFIATDVLEFEPNGTFDLIVLDNVFEHLPDQTAVLQRVACWLAPGGVCFLLTPNKLWPVEAHYHLPFLSYLSLPWANRYLRWSGRGTDYTDSSYAPTYGQLRRMCSMLPGISAEFVLPADMRLATGGNSWTYQIGAALLRRCSRLWWISKALLVVLRKNR